MIFTVARSGGSERQLTQPGPEASDFEPDWSPDGSRIAFTRSGRSGPAIYAVQPDGSGLTRVSRGCRRAKPRRCDQDVTPAFSPSGRDIAFASSDGRLKAAIVIVGSDGRNRRVVVPASSGAELIDPRFSPDANRIAFERHNLTRTPRDGRAIFVVNFGSGLSRVTPWNLDAGDPDWSPDGSWILFGSSENLKGAVAAVSDPSRRHRSQAADAHQAGHAGHIRLVRAGRQVDCLRRERRGRQCRPLRHARERHGGAAAHANHPLGQRPDWGAAGGR